MLSNIANVIDTEFSGNILIEVGLTTVDLSARRIINTYSIPINPNYHGFMQYPESDYDPAVFKLTGWTYKKLQKQGVQGQEASRRLLEKYGCKNRLLVVDQSNEISSLAGMLSHIDINIDQASFGQDILNISHLFMLKHGVQGLSLEEMLAYEALQFVGRQHRAADDSYNIARLFLELVGHDQFYSCYGKTPMKLDGSSVYKIGRIE